MGTAGDGQRCNTAPPEKCPWDFSRRSRELERQLKVRRFEPEDLGKLSFYVEALDRDVKKPHERPSIGVLGS